MDANSNAQQSQDDMVGDAVLTEDHLSATHQEDKCHTEVKSESDEDDELADALDSYPNATHQEDKCHTEVKSESDEDGELANALDSHPNATPQPRPRKRKGSAASPRGPSKVPKSKSSSLSKATGSGAGQAWTAPDMARFFDAIEKHGRNWTNVGREIGRARTSCQAKWKQVRRQFET